MGESYRSHHAAMKLTIALMVAFLISTTRAAPPIVRGGRIEKINVATIDRVKASRTEASTRELVPLLDEHHELHHHLHRHDGMLAWHKQRLHDKIAHHGGVKVGNNNTAVNHKKHHHTFQHHETHQYHVFGL